MVDKKVFTISDIAKEVQRLQYDIAVSKDYDSAIQRCKTLDELLFNIEEGVYLLDLDAPIVKKITY